MGECCSLNPEAPPKRPQVISETYYLHWGYWTQPPKPWLQDPQGFTLLANIRVLQPCWHCWWKLLHLARFILSYFDQKKKKKMTYKEKVGGGEYDIKSNRKSGSRQEADFSLQSKCVCTQSKAFQFTCLFWQADGTVGRHQWNWAPHNQSHPGITLCQTHF